MYICIHGGRPRQGKAGGGRATRAVNCSWQARWTSLRWSLPDTGFINTNTVTITIHSIFFEAAGFLAATSPSGPAASAAAASASAGSRLVKRVIAEMGGKNAIIVDDDADLDEAVVAVVQSGFGFQGQKCSACSRVIVLDRVHDAFVGRLAEAVKSLRVGPADEPGTRMGPLVDAEARDRVRSFIAEGRRTAREVAAVEVGGGRR